MEITDEQLEALALKTGAVEALVGEIMDILDEISGVKEKL